MTGTGKDDAAHRLQVVTSLVVRPREFFFLLPRGCDVRESLMLPRGPTVTAPPFANPRPGRQAGSGVGSTLTKGTQRMPNTEMLRRVMARVEEEAEVGRLKQEMWFETLTDSIDLDNRIAAPSGNLYCPITLDCNTAGCFAGWTVIEAGGTLVVPRWEVSRSRKRTVVGHVLMPGDATPQMLARVAEELLGLDAKQADRLFDALNTLDDLRSIVEELCEEPVQEPVP